MSIKTEWYDKGDGIILQTFEGQWTYNDLLQLFQGKRNWQQIKEARHFIMDMRHSQMIPTGMISNISQFKTVLQNTPGVTVVVSNHPLCEAMVHTAMRLQNEAKLYTAHNIEEAVMLIKQSVATH